ncbi:Cytoskeleton-associated protein 2, partial [Merops nubicus]
EQRRQKVEEYLSRKKTFSGVPIQENKAPGSSRTRRATSSKLQDKIQLSTSSRPEMENKENANNLSWDESSGTSEKKAILKSSTIVLTNSISGRNYNPEDQASKDEVIEIKPNVSLSRSFLQIKSIKEKQLIAEKQNSSLGPPKKPVPGTYRGRVIQSKINSFRKPPESEGEKSSLLDKKLLPSATKRAVTSLPTSSCTVVLKTTKVTNYSSSVKPNGVRPVQSKPSGRAAVNLQSRLKKCQPTSAVAPKRVTVEKTIGGRTPQPLKAASNSLDHRVPGVKKRADFCEDARPETPGKPVSVVPGTKSGQNSKTNGNRNQQKREANHILKCRARLDEWRASRGKVLRRPPISVFLGSQPRTAEQELSFGDSFQHISQSEELDKTLAGCLQLVEQGCQGDEVRAMLEDLTHRIPGAKKLAKYWVCWMRLEQMGPPEKVIAVFEEAILAGATPKDELRHTLIDAMKNTESLFKAEDGGTVTEAHLSEGIEVSKEPNSCTEQVQEAFNDLGYNDDQKAESDEKKAETGASTEVIKKEEMDIELKPREETLPKKNKKHKTKDRTKKKGKYEKEEQDEDGVKATAPAVHSPVRDNDASSSVRYNPSTTPCLESVKMHGEANDLKIITPLRYSQRIREKMCKLVGDHVKDQDPCVSSCEELQEMESNATALIHKQSNEVKETSAEVEE